LTFLRNSFDPNPFQVEEALALLEATPGVLRSLLDSLPHNWLHFKEDPEAWSPHTVLVHLVHNERTNWIPRARVVLLPDAVRKFPPFHQLPEEGEPMDGGVPELLAEFTRLRQEGLSFIRALRLGPAQLDREAEHPSLGTVTLRHLLATWVVHDLNHLHQIAKSLAKRYQVAVGPWRQYLAILDL
jgi:hypothetical protein